MTDTQREARVDRNGIIWDPVQTGTNGLPLEMPRLPTMPYGKDMYSTNATAVGKANRTAAVPEYISDAELGALYINIESLKPPQGTRWPDSMVTPTNGGSRWPCWVIHRSPDDFPGKYVARFFVNDVPTHYLFVKDSYEEVLAEIPTNLTRWEGSKGSFSRQSTLERWT